MASISVPITFNLPDNWLDMLFAKAKEDGVFVPVIRCKNCKWHGHPGCAIGIVDDTDEPSDDDYCSFAELNDIGSTAKDIENAPDRH